MSESVQMKADRGYEEWCRGIVKKASLRFNTVKSVSGGLCERRV